MLTLLPPLFLHFRALGNSYFLIADHRHQIAPIRLKAGIILSAKENLSNVSPPPEPNNTK